MPKKTEDGKEFGAGAYLYVPDKEKPSTWKLRIEEEPGEVTVAQLGRAAAALGPGFRGRRVDLPSEERKKAAKKLIRLYHQHGVDDEEIPEHLFEIAGMKEPAKALDLRTADTSVKALGGNRIGGYAVLWGDPSTKDVTGEYFAPDTAELTRIFEEMGRLPALYHHAGDDVLKSTVIGPVDVLEKDEIGLWYEAQLKLADKYRDVIRDLISKGALGTSTGALPLARKVAPDGKIERWPIVEISLTPTPAEPRMLERPVAEIKAAYEAIGLDFPAAEGQDDEGAEEARQNVKAQEIEFEMEMLRLIEIDEVDTKEQVK